MVALRAALDGSGPAIRVPPPGAVVSAEDQVVPQRVAVVVETSGSSGPPKRVALATSALLTSASATLAELGGPGHWLLCLPTHYVAGLQVLVRSVTAEADPFVLPPGGFDAAAFMALARTLPAGERRYSSLVPVQLARLLDLAERDSAQAEVLRSFDALLIGGQSTPQALRERAAALGVKIRLTYGSSETAGGCVYDGVPLRDVQMRVEDGQVLLGGPILAEGYLDAAGALERTVSVFGVLDGERWYRTGDAGAIIDGRLRVTGRLDRVIISGGEKVSLDVVESLLREGTVLDAVVVRRADEQWGEVPVVVTAQEAPALAVVRALVVDRLGRAAAPAAVLAVPTMPLLASGKPDRRALERVIAEAG
ncbi:o-succinylbenzoate--CoA ligase [Rathayibacter iranicus]|uniref:O-succinylbenzoate--CoA ligase n=1 Tax=Rathayibacter iranicus TaxID=59737 RepID=A0AAD1AH30_9MICO|nr:AMP-binding protein [Rathayibacter iranicus]AZZ57532.1 o-succinylbenzoate--CoA ligase [Rathayibacter iranicus]MWV29693.1 AMP-binding protein [Rathayibacter iranicus NCPPB 2253 = VKM Ac-1602]PPI41638.1 o-succinylbenzoate--CoA ligase [Rathayibacter iranicus]PPI57491.1 o-succinylbenzoate--CoA ligase [Rathayibacter iranicus]PPI68447.1 o-succinylbenzoate--CoA ligase [Rathayibacter iranicus]